MKFQGPSGFSGEEKHRLPLGLILNMGLGPATIGWDSMTHQTSVVPLVARFQVYRLTIKQRNMQL